MDRVPGRGESTPAGACGAAGPLESDAAEERRTRPRPMQHRTALLLLRRRPRWSLPAGSNCRGTPAENRSGSHRRPGTERARCSESTGGHRPPFPQGTGNTGTAPTPPRPPNRQPERAALACFCSSPRQDGTGREGGLAGGERPEGERADGVGADLGGGGREQGKGSRREAERFVGTPSYFWASVASAVVVVHSPVCA